jgi:hypothetical protein
MGGMMSLLRTISLLFVLSFPASAQHFIKETYGIPVSGDNGPVDHPFTGGLYNPMHQFTDIDADGDLDLFLYEPSDSRLSFFRNTGTPLIAQWSYEHSPFVMPPAFGWFRLVDINGDSKLDFLTSTVGANALAVYLNDGTGQVPDFSLLTTALLDSAGAVVYCESYSIAPCSDLDADGDLDFLSLNTGPGTINYYENIGNAENFLLAFRTDRYQDIQICIGCGAGSENPALHGNGTIHLDDLNADGDLDMLYGDLFHTGIYYFENVGTPQVAELDSVTPWFPQDDPVLTTGFNQPTLVDIDGDGDKDLFVSVLTSLIRKDNFRRYTNTGTPQSFEFALTDLNYLETLDFELQSAPAFVDIDADNDQDLFVGNLDGSLALLRNTGTATSPAFLLEDSGFVSGTGSLVLAPVFADIDDDNDLDLFVGHFAGKIEFHRNVGTPASPLFARELWAFDTLTVGFYAAPAFFDIDADGDDDLFVGKSAGTISFYRNIGTPQLPRFSLETTTFAGITVGGNLKPLFTDEDHDADEDLLVGASDGTLRFYRNDGPQGNPVFTLMTTEYAQIDSVHECAPALADLDGDGDKDLMIGCQRGGLEFYRNPEATSVGETPGEVPGEFLLLQNYPNPFNGQTVIGFRITDGGWVVLQIVDLLGREVATIVEERLAPGSYHRQWDATGHPSGVYFYRLQAGGRVVTRKLVLLK